MARICGAIISALDVVLAGAYGWTDYSPAMLDDEIVRRRLCRALKL